MKTLLAFQVKGNGTDPAGNPKAKLRMTGAQSWRPEVQDYANFKREVQRAALRTRTEAERREIDLRMATVKRAKPFILPTDGRCFMRVLIGWKGHAHADPEGVYGAIADALFQNDRELDGAFVHSQAKDGIPFVAVSVEHMTDDEYLELVMRPLQFSTSSLWPPTSNCKSSSTPSTPSASASASSKKM